MPINIIINGAYGKMGRTTVAAIANEKEFALMATLGRDDDLTAAIKTHRADVVIDWTAPASVFDNAKKIIEAGARPVIGTTGLTQEEIQTLDALCSQKKLGGVIAPNFSMGAILMMKYAQDAAKYFLDVEVIEYHHSKKCDAPSGTARKTAELIAKSRTHKNTSASIDAALKNKVSRGEMIHNIPVHAVRITGVFANEEIIFGNNGETFTLQHHATDRNAMMPGLFLCCRKVMELDYLVYGIEHFIS